MDFLCCQQPPGHGPPIPRLSPGRLQVPPAGSRPPAGDHVACRYSTVPSACSASPFRSTPPRSPVQIQPGAAAHVQVARPAGLPLDQVGLQVGWLLDAPVCWSACRSAPVRLQELKLPSDWICCALQRSSSSPARWIPPVHRRSAGALRPPVAAHLRLPFRSGARALSLLAANSCVRCVTASYWAVLAGCCYASACYWSTTWSRLLLLGLLRLSWKLA